MSDGKTIIPIASGKGGVGKSFLTANLAVALAEKGFPTIAVDLDLGGSNLHSFLGLPNRFPGVGDFLKARTSELEDLLVSTGIPNLSFLAGEGRSPFLANLPFAQKIRLLKKVRSLPARYILLDLGAGSTYNTLDFFRIAPKGLVVTTPEYTSLMGMLGFLKQCCLRVVVRTVSKLPEARERVEALCKQPMSSGRLTMAEILNELQDVEPTAAESIRRFLKNFRPRLVFNMGRDSNDMDMTLKIDQSLRKILSIDIDYFGFVFEDAAVRQSIKDGAVFLPSNRECATAKSIEQVANRIARFWNRPIPESARRIRENIEELL
jgi:flagellar biosynthesis protein FlhG